MAVKAGVWIEGESFEGGDGCAISGGLWGFVL